MAPHTTWRIGGAARWLLAPADVEELARLLAEWPPELPRLILGGGSNLLVADAGFAGLVVDLAHALGAVRVDRAQAQVVAQAGVKGSVVAHAARRAGLAGAEFLAGIPGTVGGAVCMNAGAYGGEVAGILAEVALLDAAGQPHTRRPQQLAMGYRRGGVPPGWVVTEARFQLTPDDPEVIRQRLRDNHRRRVASQPLAYPSAGSVFKNPAHGPKAWQLIQAAGLRGTRLGDAQVAERHCNFFLNLGRASSADMCRLIDMVRRQVEVDSGVTLELEVAIVTPTGLQRDI